MVRLALKKKNLKEYSAFLIRIKGDGKNYQFRIQSDKNDWFSYIYSFETTGDWQELVIPFSDMRPVFRGRSLEKNNFAGDSVASISFFIGNKKNEKFELQIDKIGLVN